VELAKVSPFQLSRKALNTLAALTIIFDIHERESTTATRPVPGCIAEGTCARHCLPGEWHQASRSD
jgi:hypothetical protein